MKSTLPCRALAGAWIALAMSFAIGVRSGPAAAGQEAVLKQDWQNRYTTVLARETSAEARVEASHKVMRKARQRDRFKGEHRTEILTELEAAQEDLAQARKLISEFPDAARRAGIPPGWLREVEARQAHEN